LSVKAASNKLWLVNSFEFLGLTRLADEVVVVSMRANPDPVNPLRDVQAQGSIILANSNGPQFTNSLKVKGGMTGISLQQGEVLVCQLANLYRQSAVKPPEAR
jgi:hypothetical protein